jgi:enoyl-CoA hydratase/carnithine racemase
MTINTYRTVGMVIIMAPGGQIKQKRSSVYRFMLDRPEKGNSLDPDLVSRLHESLSQAESEETYTAFALEASGPAFCSGADVQACSTLMGNPNDLLEFFGNARAFMRRLSASRLVTISLVNGVVAAGGLELVSACDIVIASEKSTFSDRHARYGFVPAFGATAFLPSKIGYSAAAFLLLGDGSLSAIEAMRVGLVSQIFKDLEFEHESDAFLKNMERLDPTALATIKSLMHQRLYIDDAMRAEKSAVKRHRAQGGYDITKIDF